MDYSPIVAQVWGMLTWFIPAAMLQALQTGSRAPTLATHREHVQNLKRRSDPTAGRQCPKCSSALLIHMAKAGPGEGITVEIC